MGGGGAAHPFAVLPLPRPSARSTPNAGGRGPTPSLKRWPTARGRGFVLCSAAFHWAIAGPPPPQCPGCCRPRRQPLSPRAGQVPCWAPWRWGGRAPLPGARPHRDRHGPSVRPRASWAAWDSGWAVATAEVTPGTRTPSPLPPPSHAPAEVRTDSFTLCRGADLHWPPRSSVNTPLLRPRAHLAPDSRTVLCLDSFPLLFPPLSNVPTLV